MTQSEIIFTVRESPEAGYEACVLAYSIFTQADSIEELNVVVSDAVSAFREWRKLNGLADALKHAPTTRSMKIES